MSGKKTLIWAVTLLVLAAFYYQYEIQGGQKWQEAASKREVLFQFAADDVTGFTVKREQETVRARSAMGIGISRNPWRCAVMTRNTRN